MPDIGKLKKTIMASAIPDVLKERIYEGLEPEGGGKDRDANLEYFRELMARMDALLPRETIYRLIDSCACCKSGERLANVKEFARENSSLGLDDKLKALGEVRNMGNPHRVGDKLIETSIRCLENGEYACVCSCFRFAKKRVAVSRSYCYCCAGHYRFHYQKALGLKLETSSVVSSALESLGKEYCIFRYAIVQ